MRLCSNELIDPSVLLPLLPYLLVFRQEAWLVVSVARVASLLHDNYKRVLSIFSLSIVPIVI